MPDVTYYISQNKDFYIGSHASNNIQIRGDRYIDKKHARIIFKNDGFYITSLSKNPIQVNHRPIKEVKLGNGNQIRIGNAIFIFQEQKSTNYRTS